MKQRIHLSLTSDLLKPGSHWRISRINRTNVAMHNSLCLVGTSTGINRVQD